MKIRGFNNHYQLTIPKDLVKAKGWEIGTDLRFVEMANGEIILRPIKK